MQNEKLQLTAGKLIINGNIKNGTTRMIIRPVFGIVPTFIPSTPN